MKTIDLQKIIDSQELNKVELAKELFPTNKYPSVAMTRVLKGETVLDANQISKLALLTGFKIGELYDGGEWDMRSKDDVITFSTGTYRAELNLKTNITKVFDRKTLLHESVICSGAVPLSEYISLLNNLLNSNDEN